MDLMKKFLVLLAIFCIIGSAAAVSAADVYDDSGAQLGSDVQANDGYDVNQSQIEDGYAGSQYQDDGGWAGCQYNDTDNGLTDRPIIDPDYNHTEPAAGAPVNNTTANASLSQSVGQNASASHNMPATGNPIFALFAVGAILGGYAVISKRR